MIEVVALMCSIQVPNRCKDVHLTFAAETITPQQCMMYGQAELAKWTVGNPEWGSVRRFTCRRVGQFSKA